MRLSSVCILAAIALLDLSVCCPSVAVAESYRVVNPAKVGGAGGFDYVIADAEGRRLYIPRFDEQSGRVTVFNIDTLESIGEIPDTKGARGVAIDPKSHHAFSSSKPVVMFDTRTLETIKTIDVDGNPDAILFEPSTARVFVFSHRPPNATVINSEDGSVVGTIDLGGAPEQAVSDSQGHVYVDIEDMDQVAVVDPNTLKVTGRYDLEGRGGGPAGLAIDAKNHLLFAGCRQPQSMVILNATNGQIIASLPIGSGVDGAVFNPHTMEVFSSQRDGTLTVIKENSPTSFEVEQNVQTKPGAKTCTLDAKTDQIVLITAEPLPQSSQDRAGGAGRRGGRWLPDSFTILVVGK